jgi:hypothetical protein
MRSCPRMEGQQAENKNHWQNGLTSLSIAPKRKNKLNDKKELEAPAKVVKEVYFQDYNIAYDSHTEIDNSHFDILSSIASPPFA